MEKFISCLVFLNSKLNKIASCNDSLHKHWIFWIIVGLMRGAQKYELVYLWWECLLRVRDMNVRIGGRFVLGAYVVQVYLGLPCLNTLVKSLNEMPLLG